MDFFKYNNTSIKLKVIVEPTEEGYIAYIPSLPGCFSEGFTIEETIENLKEVIQDYLDLDFDIISLSISAESSDTREIAG